MVFSLERWVQSSHFVENASKWPDVTLLIVVLVINLFRTHVVGSPYVSLSIHALISQDSRKSKIAKFHVFFAINENISRL